MPAPTDLPDIKLDADQLYQETVITDRRVGTIRKLDPVRADGSPDPERSTVFEGQASLMTPGGAMPLNFEIDASSLDAALEQYPASARVALEQTLEEIETMRREQASSIVMPGQGGPGGTGGQGGAGGPGGLIGGR